jgi:hypothetical protein
VNNEAMKNQTPDEVAQVRAKVVAERAELGRTVEELAARFDVPTRVKGRIRLMLSKVYGVGYRTFHNVQLALHNAAVSMRSTGERRRSVQDRRARVRAGRALAAGPVAKVTPPSREPR